MTSKRFKPVQQIADNKERKAAASLGESLKDKEAAAQKLQELRGYHAEYLKSFHLASQQGMGSAQLQEYRTFLGKLELAIQEQQQVVNSAQQVCSSRRDLWRGQYTKTRALNNAVTRMQDDETRLQERQEQAATDDQNNQRRH